MLAGATLLAIGACGASRVALNSPDGALRAIVSQGAKGSPITLELSHNGIPMLSPSPIGLELRQAKAPRLGKGKLKSNITEHISAPFYRQSRFDVTYNQLTIPLGNGTTLELRAFDDGIAYRYVLAGPAVVVNETASYKLPGNVPMYLATPKPEETLPYHTAFENVYATDSLSHAAPKPAFLPAMADFGNGLKLTFAESDLQAYPGMFLRPDSAALSLNATFAPYPKEFGPAEHCSLYVKEGDDFIAKTTAPRPLPWRVLAVTTDDRQLPANNLVYALAEPSRIADTSWIKPGQAQWDWWNDWNVTGVPFQAGINNDTYKYYIDYAAAHGIPYAIIDWIWYDKPSGDLMHSVPELDIPMLVAYAKSKGVGIMLWAVFEVLDKQLEEALAYYGDMGVAGFKVDFLNRDDQTAVEQAWRIAQAAADHKMVLNYHGFYKPSGLNRTYPNILNFEGIFGLENVKWTDNDNMPAYDVTYPFIRMFSGPADYTPGAMSNANRDQWQASWPAPKSQGTRAHQAALYVVTDSPLAMLSDSPTAYAASPDYSAMLYSLPTTFEQTQVVQGKVGEYIVTARKGFDGAWYIGALTNWDSRDLELSLDFLPGGRTYTATILADGRNADRNANDYTITTQGSVSSQSTLPLRLAPGGGAVIILR